MGACRLDEQLRFHEKDGGSDGGGAQCSVLPLTYSGQVHPYCGFALGREGTRVVRWESVT